MSSSGHPDRGLVGDTPTTLIFRRRVTSSTVPGLLLRSVIAEPMQEKRGVCRGRELILMDRLFNDA